MTLANHETHFFRDSIEIQNLDLASNINDDKNHKKKRHSNSLDIAEVHCSQHQQIIENRDKHFSMSENKLQTIMKREINIYVNENAMRDDRELLEIDDKKEMQGEKEETKRVVPHFIEWQAPIVEWLSPIKDWQVWGVLHSQNKYDTTVIPHSRPLSANTRRAFWNGTCLMESLTWGMEMGLGKRTSFNLNKILYVHHIVLVLLLWAY